MIHLIYIYNQFELFMDNLESYGIYSHIPFLNYLLEIDGYGK